ncbi:MAG TPA: cysteine desulfurase NifS [Chthoniobacterales bacterium]
MSIRPKDIIYLDSNGTTSVDPAVVSEMMPYLTDFYGNPSSAYGFGSQLKEAIDTARERIAALIGCDPSEIIFTSCGTESNNAVLQSALVTDPDRQHIITSTVEHSAIIKHGETLAKRGIEVTWLPVDFTGRLDLDDLKKAIRPDTALVSLMWANNETGVLFPIEEAAEIAREKGVLFHTDAVQAVGKIPINLRNTKVNFLSLSGHKLHCPKGIGVLYVNRRTRFNSYLIGGGQENGKRAGTENVPYIVGLGKAAELARETMDYENTEVKKLRDHFENTLLDAVDGIEVNGDRELRLPNTSNVAIHGVESEALLILLDQKGICCSGGSACTTGSLHPSHVLIGMGFSAERARGSVRFSFSRFNTQDEIDRALKIIIEAIQRLRRLSPKQVQVVAR